MFGSNKNKIFTERKDTERSLISETVSIDGTVNSSGAIDIAGLIKGPVFSKDIKDKYNSLYTKKQVVQQVKEMLNYISDITNGDIQFPKNEDVYMDLKPYLQLYYVSEYCSDEFVKQRTLQELKCRMKRILTGNPLYGRRIRKPNNLFTSNNINDIHKQIANLKGKPLSKKYTKGHTINTKRTTFHHLFNWILRFVLIHLRD